MTNEEAYNIISEFCFTGYEDNKKPSFKLFGAIHELILDVEENTKLKAEIEQWQSTNLKLVCELTRLECENYQLKVGAKRKWKCVYLDNPEDAVFTLGKIYEVENGSITDDFGNSYYNNESTDDLFIWINKFDKFEEVKEK